MTTRIIVPDAPDPSTFNRVYGATDPAVIWPAGTYDGHVAPGNNVPPADLVAPAHGIVLSDQHYAIYVPDGSGYVGDETLDLVYVSYGEATAIRRVTFQVIADTPAETAPVQPTVTLTEVTIRTPTSSFPGNVAFTAHLGQLDPGGSYHLWARIQGKTQWLLLHADDANQNVATSVGGQGLFPGAAEGDTLEVLLYTSSTPSAVSLTDISLPGVATATIPVGAALPVITGATWDAARTGYVVHTDITIPANVNDGAVFGNFPNGSQFGNLPVVLDSPTAAFLALPTGTAQQTGVVQFTLQHRGDDGVTGTFGWAGTPG